MSVLPEAEVRREAGQILRARRLMAVLDGLAHDLHAALPQLLVVLGVEPGADVELLARRVADAQGAELAVGHLPGLRRAALGAPESVLLRSVGVVLALDH